MIAEASYYPTSSIWKSLLSSAPLKLAIVGFGRMGRIYADTIEASELGSVHAVVEPQDELRGRARNEVNARFYLKTLEEALVLADLDGVIIATPTSLHARQVLDSARARKAIFCEKPLALSLSETEIALAGVRDSRVPLQVGFMRRFDPAYMSAYSSIQAGDIGTPLTIKCIGRDPFCPDPAFANPAKSGGLIHDMGIHDFDLCRWLMDDEVVQVSAMASTMACPELAAVGDFDNATINVTFAGGALGNIEVSRSAFYGYDVRTEVVGTEGALLIGGHGSESVVHLPRRGKDSSSTYLMDRFEGAYRGQIDAFIAAVTSGQPPSVTGDDALEAFRIGAAATAAAKSGNSVPLVHDITRRP